MTAWRNLCNTATLTGAASDSAESRLMESSTTSSFQSHRSNSRETLDLLLCGDNRELAFADPEGIFFTKTSTADVFDISDGKGTLFSDLHDEELQASLEIDKNRVQCDPRIRLIFIDGIRDDPNRLPVSSEMLSLIFDTYNITPRFAGFLSRQQLPGRALHYDSECVNPVNYELWYSAVIRSLYEHGDRAPDLSRKVLDWSSFCLWSDYSFATGDATVLVWRCPAQLKQKFYSTFQGCKARELQRHPLLLHAFFMEHVIVHTYDFLQKFSEPLYAWEFKANEMRSAEDYTRRSQSFLALSRQIQQVATDYDILMDTVELLQRAHIRFEELFERIPETNFGNRLVSKNQKQEMRETLCDIFDRFLGEVKLIRTYNSLYIERTRIGVNECFALVNQRDAEVNIQMASESTQIARASHQDNRSLRIIQIMSMLFLPASLVSSIFGMGFFSTSAGADGKSVFVVSGNWWLYIAVSVPLTSFVLLFMSGYRMRHPKEGVMIARDVEAQRELKND